jgi:hypothetical protein
MRAAEAVFFRKVKFNYFHKLPTSTKQKPEGSWRPFGFGQTKWQENSETPVMLSSIVCEDTNNGGGKIAKPHDVKSSFVRTQTTAEDNFDH